MRTLQALLLCFALAAIGCGEEDGSGPLEGNVGGSGGTGGQGGSGGAGGTGGAGGSGGTGGTGGGQGGSGGTGGEGGTVIPGDDCGNGRLDGDEACDDGNELSSDGCSATCALEGSCAAPIDWMTVSSIGPLGRSFDGTIRAPGADLEGSCGAPGGEVVYRLVAPHDGVFSLSHESDLTSFNYVRTSCEEPASELFCRQELVAFRHEVEQGQELFFVVDLPEGADEAVVTIVAEVFPYKAEGESCGPAASAQCAPGLTCDDISVFRQCKVNEPPVLDSVQLFRDGDALSLIVEGSDPNGNQAHVVDLRFFDAEEAPLLVGDRDRDGIPDDPVLWVTIDFAPGDTTEFDWTAWVDGLFAAHPEIARAEVSVRDTAGVASPWIDAPILPLPIVAEGGACDLRVRADRCEDGATCYPDLSGGPVCRSLATVRQERCAAAPLVVFGTELEGQVARDGVDGRGHWDPPEACISRPVAGPWTGAPEGLARLHLDAEVENLVITTDIIGSMNTVLYLLPGCGEGDPTPLSCSDDLAASNVRSELRFDSLAAGDYLIVVDMRESTRRAAPWSLVVEVAPD